MVHYLQEEYPEARISIHNGPNESLVHAFARLTMAKQSFVSLSTFGIFPIVASFGDGYFQKPHSMINYWVNRLVASPEHYPYLHMMRSPKLTPANITEMNFSGILKWFVTD